MAYTNDYIERSLARPTGRQIFAPGIAAGIVAAVAMAVFAMIVSAARGAGFFAPMRLIAAAVLGLDALTAGGGAAILGMAIHLAVGAGFGLLFAAMLPSGVSGLAKIGAGLLYGLGIFVVMTFLVLPWVDLPMSATLSVGWFLLYHLAFGLALVGALEATRRSSVR